MLTLDFSPVMQLLGPSDVSAYLEFLHKLDVQSEYMHYGPGERGMTEQGMRSRVKKQDKQGNSFVVLALGLDGSPIGYFSVNGGNSQATKHSATVAVGVLRCYRGRGIAGELFERARQEAESRGVVRFECTVVQQNMEAFNFYLAQGFKIAGALTGRFRSVQGVCLDEWVLEYPGK